MSEALSLSIVEENKLTEAQVHALRNLWNREYPIVLTYERPEDFVLYLRRLENVRHHLLQNENGIVYGWAFDYDREQEKWFGTIVDSQIQGKGFGSLLLQKLKEKNSALNGWMIDRDSDLKSNGETYKSPAKFYRKHQFILFPHERLGFDKISAIKIKWLFGA
jgi:GNAT superfamily N-acetyltransferase